MLAIDPSGKRAIVTAGSRGIGKSTALSLAEAGTEKETTIEGSNECEGNKTRAAKILGISRKSLFNRVRQYNIVNEDMPNEE